MIVVNRGEIWFANLSPTRGSEQAGIRPVIVFQANKLNKFTTTVLTIPLTTNLKRASLPTCVLISRGEGRIPNDSVALCHQLRVLDKIRLQRKIGTLSQKTISMIERVILVTIGML
ncbi:MAG: type II toxin-antitoxin system PemK/MazF family toxin [Kosmotogaceae bacterium]